MLPVSCAACSMRVAACQLVLAMHTLSLQRASTWTRHVYLFSLSAACTCQYADSLDMTLLLAAEQEDSAFEQQLTCAGHFSPKRSSNMSARLDPALVCLHIDAC